MVLYFRCKACKGEHKSPIQPSKSTFENPANKYKDTNAQCSRTGDMVWFSKPDMFWKDEGAGGVAQTGSAAGMATTGPHPQSTPGMPGPTAARPARTSQNGYTYRYTTEGTKHPVECTAVFATADAAVAAALVALKKRFSEGRIPPRLGVMLEVDGPEGRSARRIDALDLV
jgi:hypothetical protein